MAIISADGAKLMVAGEEMESLTKECAALIDELYEKLGSINKTCWVSDAANRYVSGIKNDYLQSKMVMNNLMSYSKYIKDAGSSIDGITKKWK